MATVGGATHGGGGEMPGAPPSRMSMPIYALVGPSYAGSDAVRPLLPPHATAPLPPPTSSDGQLGAMLRGVWPLVGDAAGTAPPAVGHPVATASPADPMMATMHAMAPRGNAHAWAAGDAVASAVSQLSVSHRIALAYGSGGGGGGGGEWSSNARPRSWRPASLHVPLAPPTFSLPQPPLRLLTVTASAGPRLASACTQTVATSTVGTQTEPEATTRGSGSFAESL